MIIKYTNRKRLSVSIFKKNNIVMLDSRNIKIIRSNKLLNYKNLGLFRVVRAINNRIYKLNLSKKMNIYSIFYLWLLHINNSNLLSK